MLNMLWEKYNVSKSNNSKNRVLYISLSKYHKLDFNPPDERNKKKLKFSSNRRKVFKKKPTEKSFKYR